MHIHNNFQLVRSHTRFVHIQLRENGHEIAQQLILKNIYESIKMLYTFYDDMELDTCLNLFCIMSKDTCLLFTVGVYFINQQFSFTHTLRLFQKICSFASEHYTEILLY